TAEPDPAGGPRVIVLGNSILHAVGATEPSKGCGAVLATILGGRIDGVDEWVGGGASLLTEIDGLLVGPAPGWVATHTATGEVDQPLADSVAQTAANLDRIAGRWRAPVVVVGPWGTEAGHPLDVALAHSLAGRAGYVSLASVFATPEFHD